MTWSAGRTAITPVVERAPTNAAPSVTAAQVSRPIGSAISFSFGSFGSCFRTSGAWISLVITNEIQAPLVRKQLPKLPKENVIAEPIGRDTCAAVTLGAALVGARSTTGVMAVLPADHVIPEEKKFQQVLGDAFDLAAQGQAIVTIGIKPNEPATGYVYIQTGNELPTPSGAKKSKTTFFKAVRFVEKPHY